MLSKKCKGQHKLSTVFGYTSYWVCLGQMHSGGSLNIHFINWCLFVLDINICLSGKVGFHGSSSKIESKVLFPWRPLGGDRALRSGCLEIWANKNYLHSFLPLEPMRISHFCFYFHCGSFIFLLGPSYRAVCCIWAPQVRAGPRAVVCIVTTGLMDPLPVQVTAEVDVELANTAAILRVSVMRMTNNSAISPQN